MSRTVVSTARHSAVRRVLVCTCLLLVGGIATGAARAQDEQRISLVARNIDGAITDIKELVQKSELPDQWPVLEEYIETYAFGLNRERPLRVDVLLRDGTVSLLQQYPVDNQNDFLTNIQGFGIKTIRSRDFRQRGQYRLQNQELEMYLQFHKKDDYARIATLKADVQTANPVIEPITDVLKLDVDLAAELVNPADGIDSRTETFTELKKETLAALKPGEDEDPLNYKLRKLLSEHQLEELGRFYAEAKHVVLTLDRQNDSGRAFSTLKLTPIAGTPLAKSMESLGQKPSRFAAAVAPEVAPLSVRVRHPLDPMRVENFLELSDLAKQRFDVRFDEATELTDSEKEAAKEANGIVFGIIDAGLKSGVIDMLVDVLPASGTKHTFVMAAETPASADAAKLLDLLPKIDPRVKATANVKTIGEGENAVVVHQIGLPEGGNVLPFFADFFSEDGQIFLGIGEGTIFVAGGENAMEKLTAVVEASGQEVPESVDPKRFLTVTMQAAPWLERRQRRDVPTEYPKLRAKAVEILKGGDDAITLFLEAENGVITGQTNIQPGLMRIAGEILAQYSKDNLDE